MRVNLTLIMILVAGAIAISLFIVLFSKLKNLDKKGLSDGIANKKENELTYRKSDESDNLEMIAVLTAAINSSMSNPNVKFQVKSFRRIGQETPVWNRIGRKDQIINNRLNLKRIMD